MPLSAQPSRNSLWRRPEIGPLALNVAVATYLLVLCNTTFWRKLGKIFAGDPGHVMLFGAAVAMLTLFTLMVFTVPRLHRPVLALLILVSSAAAYHQDRLGIVIDREMVQNIMRTSVSESKQLLSPSLVIHVLLTGVLPALLIFVPRIRYPRLRHFLWRWPLSLALTFALFAGFLFTDFKAFSAAIREHRDLMAAYQPGATIAAVTRYAKQELRAQNVVAQPLGTDATKGPRLTHAGKPVLTVVFAGETARAQNFGLNGYARDTTPGLRTRNVVNFPDASSCGTSTAVSLPCMFSNLTMDGYSHTKFVGTENLLDVLTHAGIKVEWWDNNTGDQTIAKRLGWTRIDKNFDPAACAEGECTDQALVTLIDQKLKTITEDTVLVLHMIGSHGPSYYQRYPRAFAKFKPECTTTEFTQCTPEQITNTYDNTILFTDHVLSQAIDLMQAQDRVVPALLFMSDHGESLGENGLYLHAAPRFMAPETQTKVPFVMWLSPLYQRSMGITADCLQGKTSQPVSHDNLFHTVLGLMDVQTTVRNPDLDLTAGCTAAAG